MYEIGSNGERTGRVLYQGHLDEFNSELNSFEIISKGTVTGTMGSTGIMVVPKGFIHSHDEIRSQPDWNVPYDRATGRRQQLGDLMLW